MYIASNPRRFLGQSVGNGQCVAFARAAAGMGHTSTWQRGQRVKGAVLVPGTAIATFDDDGTYANHTDGRSHAAIYLGQDATGIIVLDQWIEVARAADGTVKKEVQPVHQRHIRFRYSKKAVNDGGNYHVIE